MDDTETLDENSECDDLSQPSTIITDVSSSSEEDESIEEESRIEEVEEKNSCVLHEVLTLERLRELKKHFHPDGAPDGGIRLDMQAFVDALRWILMGIVDIDDSQFVTLFMRVDVDTTGSVDWDELTGYLLTLDDANRKMHASAVMTDLVPNEAFDRKFSIKSHGIHHQHRDMIEKIIGIERVGMHAYVSASRDGTIRFWNRQSLQLLRVINHVECVKRVMHEQVSKLAGGSSEVTSSRLFHMQEKALHTSGWVTDIELLPLGNRLAVACLDSSVSFYELLTGELISRIHGLRAAPHCLACFKCGEEEQVVLWGDECGQLHWLNLGTNFQMYINNDKNHAVNGEAARWKNSEREVRDQGVILAHTDSVTRAKYILDLDRVITSSLDGTIRMTDWAKGRVMGTFSAHMWAIHSFTYCPDHRIIASVGVGREVLLWNPYTLNVIARFTGHNASIMHCAYDSEHGRIITCSADKVIKCWDVSSYKCLQTFIHPQTYRPDDKITALFWDQNKRTLILGGNRLAAWSNLGTMHVSETTHDAPVCKALYARNFRQILSADADGVVSVWAIETGQLIFRFRIRSPQTKTIVSTRVTFISLDMDGRRLMSGFDDGSMSLWNFSNGQHLQSFSSRSRNFSSSFHIRKQSQEISGCALVRQECNDAPTNFRSVTLFVASSWDGRIRVYQDKPSPSSVTENITAEPPKRVLGDEISSHRSDELLCITACGGLHVASGSLKGKVSIWSLDSGSIRMTLRPELHEVRADDDVSSLGGFTSKGMDLQQGGVERRGKLPFGDEFNEVTEDKDSGLNLPSIKDEDEGASAVDSAVNLSNDSDSPQPEEVHPPKADSRLNSSAWDLQQQQKSKSPGLFVPHPPLTPSRSQASVRKKHLNASTPAMEGENTLTGGDNRGESSIASSALTNFSQLRKRSCGLMAINVLLYLKNANIVISANAAGHLHFWDCIDGACLHAIPAEHPNDSGITAMASGGKDGSENMLYTGRVAGTIKVWKLGDLESLTYSAKVHRKGDKAQQKLPFAENDEALSQDGEQAGAQGRKLCFGQSMWEAHQDSIESIIGLSLVELDVLVTASSDCNVHVWTLNGAHIGNFGKSSPWSLTKPATWICQGKLASGDSQHRQSPIHDTGMEGEEDKDTEFESSDEETVEERAEDEMRRRLHELRHFKEMQAYRASRLRLDKKLTRSRVNTFCVTPRGDDFESDLPLVNSVIEEMRNVESAKTSTKAHPDSKSDVKQILRVNYNQVWNTNLPKIADVSFAEARIKAMKMKKSQDQQEGEGLTPL